MTKHAENCERQLPWDKPSNLDFIHNSYEYKCHEYPLNHSISRIGHPRCEVWGLVRLDVQHVRWWIGREYLFGYPTQHASISPQQNSATFTVYRPHDHIISSIEKRDIYAVSLHYVSSGWIGLRDCQSLGCFPCSSTACNTRILLRKIELEPIQGPSAVPDISRVVSGQMWRLGWNVECGSASHVYHEVAAHKVNGDAIHTTRSVSYKAAQAYAALRYCLKMRYSGGVVHDVFDTIHTWAAMMSGIGVSERSI